MEKRLNLSNISLFFFNVCRLIYIYVCVCARMSGCVCLGVHIEVGDKTIKIIKLN